MTIRVDIYYLDYEQRVVIDDKKRRDVIIDYIRKNPECYKEEVVRYCQDKGIAARETVRKTLETLQKDGVVNIVKEKDNSKSYKLTVNFENLLIILPRQLDDIFIQFQEFVDAVNKLSQNEDEIHHRVENSIYGDSIDEHHYDRIRESLPLLPYIVIDVINDVFTFSFIFVWSKEIDDQNHFLKLYPIFYEKISRMYSFLAKKLYNTLPADNYFPSGSYPLYVNYLKSKKYDNFTKVCYLAYLCTIFGIEDSLYKVLDLLWINNMKSVSLMYADDLENIFLYYKTEYERRSQSAPYIYPHMSQLKASNKHREYSDDTLNKIHVAINYFILVEKGLELDKILPEFKIQDKYFNSM